MIVLIYLGAAFVVSVLVTLGILVVDRLQHPPKNGSYPDMEKPYVR